MQTRTLRTKILKIESRIPEQPSHPTALTVAPLFNVTGVYHWRIMDGQRVSAVNPFGKPYQVDGVSDEWIQAHPNVAIVKTSDPATVLRVNADAHVGNVEEWLERLPIIPLKCSLMHVPAQGRDYVRATLCALGVMRAVDADDQRAFDDRLTAQGVDLSELRGWRTDAGTYSTEQPCDCIARCERRQAEDADFHRIAEAQMELFFQRLPEDEFERRQAAIPRRHWREFYAAENAV